MTLPILTGDRVAGVTRRLEMAVATVRSPYTGGTQAQDWGGRWWVYDLQLGPWRGSAGRPAAALFAALEATAGRFVFEDPTAVYTGGIAFPGSPLVRGAGQTGRALVTDGWTPNIPLFAGMCISIGTGAATRFHMVTADTITDASGIATLAIAPALRAQPADNAPVEYRAPKVQLRTPAAVAQQIASGGYSTFTLTAEEVL